MDHKLLNSSLTILKNMFEQRKDLIGKFKKMLICGRGNLNSVYLNLNYMRQKFEMLAHINILRYQEDSRLFKYQIDKVYEETPKDHSMRSGILQDLFFLARTLKEGINLKDIHALMAVDEELFEPGKVYPLLTEKDLNNELFQNLNIAEGIYLPLLEYIKMISPKTATPLQKKILAVVYLYLSLLSYNNSQAKQILMHSLVWVIPHLKLKVGAENLIYHVSVNNKLLINNEEIIPQIIDGVLEACLEVDKLNSGNIFAFLIKEKSELNFTSFEKSKLLLCLRGILLYNEEGHHKNQQLLIDKLLNNRFKALIFVDEIRTQRKK